MSLYSGSIFGSTVPISCRVTLGSPLLLSVLLPLDISRGSPTLEQVGVEDDIIFLKDNRLTKIVLLRVREGELYCDLDKKKDCAHVGFAWSIPKVYRIMKEHGSKRPS